MTMITTSLNVFDVTCAARTFCCLDIDGGVAQRAFLGGRCGRLLLLLKMELVDTFHDEEQGKGNKQEVYYRLNK